MGGSMAGGRPCTKIDLTAEERKKLEAVARKRTAPYREVVRARALLMAADGVATTRIAEVIGVDPSKISIWKREFLVRRVDALVDRKRSGRPRRFSPLGAGSGSSLCLPETLGSGDQADGSIHPRPDGGASDVLASTGCSARGHGSRR
jgi:hypothetical protein